MTILFISESDNPDEWRRALQKLIPNIDLRVWPNVGKRSDVHTALVWKAPYGALTNLPNLSLIQSLGAGIDHIFNDPQRPKDVPVARLVDPELTRQMVEYSVLAVLSRHRRIDELRRAAADHLWHVPQPTPFEDSRIGVLGLGEIGLSIAQKLKSFQFLVAGWSRNLKEVEGITCYHGATGLKNILHSTDILICALPLTPITKGILNKDTLALLPKGAYLVNLARGEHVVEPDLLQLIEEEHISGAFLDVFQTEPLPESHPFWKHPSITVTPHLAGLTIADSAANQVAENIERIAMGKSPLNQVDPAQGY
ncbi:MAG: glyoxylate/hydroxypyruvate reductase A [Rhodospirillaceae bacterium]|nr:glyoxylate/hydroxypyruvate reductase A [Rhodospirillaceae bacterium]